MKIKMPPSVNMVIDSLHAKGFEAYAVGGCVRDTILAREPDDWDITTSASPQQVKEIFDRTVDTGLEHGTVTVLAGSGAHEVTTYRIDGEYEDGRHPKEVVFTSSLAEDLRRRDLRSMRWHTTTKRGLWICSMESGIYSAKSSAVSEIRPSGSVRMHCGSCVPSAFRTARLQTRSGNTGCHHSTRADA